MMGSFKENVGKNLDEIKRLLEIPDNGANDNKDSQEEDDYIWVEMEETCQNYSIDELGQILYKMYSDGTSKVTAIHMFGLKYGAIIRKNGFDASSIVASAGLGESYHVELSKGIRLYEAIRNNEYGVKFISRRNYSNYCYNTNESNYPAFNRRINKNTLSIVFCMARLEREKHMLQHSTRLQLSKKKMFRILPMSLEIN